MQDQRIERDRQRKADKHKRSHTRKPPALALQEPVGVGLRQPVDDRTQEAEQHDFTNRNQCRQNSHGEKPGPCVLRIMPAECHEPLRRRIECRLGIGIEARFKPVEHQSNP